jgi:BlaI family penicillinase repressor
MPRTSGRSPLSTAQLEIMSVVWERGETTVGEVWKELAVRRKVARNTVLTLMTRLEQKGWLRLRGDGNTNLYRAAASREDTIGGMLGQLVDTAFGGSVEGLVLTLISSRGVSKDEAARIRTMIGQAERGKQ